VGLFRGARQKGQLHWQSENYPSQLRKIGTGLGTKPGQGLMTAGHLVSYTLDRKQQVYVHFQDVREKEKENETVFAWKNVFTMGCQVPACAAVGGARGWACSYDPEHAWTQDRSGRYRLRFSLSASGVDSL
jgi:hypothetical protein